MNVAFIGHRKIERTQALKERLTQIIEQLILNENADTFLFGSKSEFGDLCYEVVTALREKYKNIRRIFVRGEYEHISGQYAEYLMNFYEDSFFAEEAHGAGALSYIKRNQVMVDMSEVLVVYYDKDYKPQTRTKSGTKMSVGYAYSKNKRIINLCE